MDAEVDVPAGTGNMLADGLNTMPDIPFEVVDDEEMAAIESAFLHAQSLASAYHSIKNVQVPFGSNLGHSLVASSYSVNRNSSISSASEVQREQEQSLVYTVTSSLSAEKTSSRAGVSSFFGFTDKISSLKTSCNVARISQGDLGESNSESQSTVTLASNEISAGRTDEDGTVKSSTDPVDIMMVGSQNSTPATKAVESEYVRDIEDTGATVGPKLHRLERVSRPLSLLLRHRTKRGLSVTDFTASEWCEKQVEFSMTRGKPESTPAMKAGTVRHVQLEVEVVTRVEIEIRTKEDGWAARLLNFISGSRQLLGEGITRELPVLGLLSGTWIVGIIDEMRLVERDGQEYPMLVDTKTRRRNSPPAEPQKRNARLQLMSYKYLWDSMVETGIPSEAFFQHFGLRPQQKFCSDVRLHASSFYQECEIKCLQDLLPQITNEVVNYPLSLNILQLRYEWQVNHSLLGQDEFVYEHGWLMDRWHWHLEFWRGRRQASSVPEDETWKCRQCSFASICKPKIYSSDENLTTERTSKGQSGTLP